MADIDLICGVDEAGRGPWAGPVTAGAVILNPDRPIVGLTDSKKLSEKRRLAFESEIKQYALGWGLGWASAEEIDAVNIRQATFLAMQRAVVALNLCPTRILIDGNACPPHLPAPAHAIIKGDLTEPAISAASILAKTARDRFMLEQAKQYPEFGFDQHKGYGTQAHRTALERFGPCALHRRSFAPIRALQLQAQQ